MSHVAKDFLESLLSVIARDLPAEERDRFLSNASEVLTYAQFFYRLFDALHPPPPPPPPEQRHPEMPSMFLSVGVFFILRYGYKDFTIFHLYFSFFLASQSIFCLCVS